MQESPLTEPARETVEAKPWVFFSALSLWMMLLTAGPVLVASALALFRLARPVVLFGRVAPSLALAAAGLAVLLRVAGYAARGRRRDFRGLWVLIVLSVDAFCWLFWSAMRPTQLRADLVWSGLILSMLLAGHPALSGSRGALWPRLVLFPQLVAHAFVAGSAELVIALAYLGGSRSTANVLLRCVLGGICGHGILVLVGIALSRRTPARAAAVREMVSGPLAARFWVLAILMGTALPIYILAFHFARPDLSGLWGAIAAALAALGLLAYEDCSAGAMARARFT